MPHTESCIRIWCKEQNGSKLLIRVLRLLQKSGNYTNYQNRALISPKKKCIPNFVPKILGLPPNLSLSKFIAKHLPDD